jgi:nucleoside-diphosphate-sugar epimerase
MQVKVHEPINLGNPVEMTIEELANLVRQLVGGVSKLEYLADRRDRTDPQQRRPDIARAKELLGWEPKISLEEGLHRTMEDFRSRI